MAGKKRRKPEKNSEQEQRPLPEPQQEQKPQPEKFQCKVDAGFHEWMNRCGGSVLVSTYQTNRVVLAGWDGKQVSILLRNFDRPMGMATHGTKLVLATRHEVIRFANAAFLAPTFPEAPNQYDALYLPRQANFTGPLNLHDVAYGNEGIWVVNTRCNCLALLGDQHTFLPRWKPNFVTEMVPEDRCHLNCMAMEDGKPRFVTALGESNTKRGWVDNRLTAGIVIDVNTQEIVLRGLSIPHSPRLHRSKLWLLNSAAGEFIRFDPATRSADVVCTLPGYLRGLCLVDDVALVGMGLIRDHHLDAALPVKERFPRLFCGVAVIELATGKQLGMLEFTSGCGELYDICFLPGVRQPMILHPDSELSRRAVPSTQLGFWLPPEVDREEPRRAERI